MLNKNYKLVLFVFVSAGLWYLAWPPGYFPLLMSIFLIPILGLIDPNFNAWGLSHSKTNIFIWVFLYFLLANAFILGWISKVSLSAALVAILVATSLQTGVITFLRWAWTNPKNKFSITLGSLSFIGLWVISELAREYIFSFPWINLGFGLSNLVPLIQWYEFTGVYGGTIWILGLNLLGYDVCKWIIHSNAFKKTDSKFHSKSFILKLILYLSFGLIPVLYSIVRYETYSDYRNHLTYEGNHHLVNLAVIQSNLNPRSAVKLNSKNPSQIQDFMKLSSSKVKVNTEIILWPETLLDSDKGINEDSLSENQDISLIKEFLFPYKNASIISGAVTYLPSRNKSHDTSWYNSALEIQNGIDISIYHKQILVPGVEKSPFSFPTQKTRFNFLSPSQQHSLVLLGQNSQNQKTSYQSTSISPFMYLGGLRHYFSEDGSPKVLFTQSGLGIGVLICFESVFSDYARKRVLEGAGLLVTLSNDAWWGSSAGTFQHRDYAKILSIENRRPFAQASNGGISFLINPLGQITEELPVGKICALNGDLEIKEEISFYTRYGNWVLYFAWFNFLAGFIYLKLGGK